MARRAMARARAPGSRGGTSRASRPLPATSRQPRMSVRTRALPMAAASMAERGMPLAPGGEHEHVHHRQQVADVVAPAGDQHVPGGRGQLGLGDGVGLLEVGGADGQEPDPRSARRTARAATRGSPSRPPAGPPPPRPGRRRAARARAQGRGPLGRDPGRVEVAGVGAVAEQVAAALAGQPEAPGPGRSSSLWYSSRSSAPASHSRPSTAARLRSRSSGWHTGRGRC